MKYLVSILFLLLVVASVGAQEGETLSPNNCEVENWQFSLNTIADVITEAATNMTTLEEGLAFLMILEGAIDTIRANCGASGLFTSETPPNGIIGPILFSGTLYQVTLEAETFGSAQFLSLNGDCGAFTDPLILVADFEGGSETDLLEFEGCIALIEVNVGGAWSLNFEKLQ